MKPQYRQSTGTFVADPTVAILTGGGDRPYALGLAGALIGENITFDFVASNDLRSPDLENNILVRFLNLRGDQDPAAPFVTKLFRVLSYYIRLIRYAATSRASIFHLLWNNRFELFDRTVLTLYYKFLRKRIIFTAHNVNIRKRDGSDSWLNRMTLRCQYWMVDHIFVHTEKMKLELQNDFRVANDKISVIPFGINGTVPDTALTPGSARERLGLCITAKVILFFGNIAPYKGLEYLIAAVEIVAKAGHDYRVIVAGRPKGSESYWHDIQTRIVRSGLTDRVIQRIGYVPDEETELYFKAADVFVLPYTHVFQSGVLFLGYNFGLPVIASDVGALRDDIVEGKTGFLCQPKDSANLARCIDRFFTSDLFLKRSANRQQIKAYAYERNAWTTVGKITSDVYQGLVEQAGGSQKTSKNMTVKDSAR